jgi:hypothetical protein
MFHPPFSESPILSFCLHPSWFLDVALVISSWLLSICPSSRIETTVAHGPVGAAGQGKVQRDSDILGPDTLRVW